METYKQIYQHASLSEKAIERELTRAVEQRGGLSLKYYNTQRTGYPDRLVLLPGARVFWAELKSHGRKPTRLQTIRHEELRSLGFPVYVIDNKQQIYDILSSY